MQRKTKDYKYSWRDARGRYFWLREKTNPAVMAHLQAENTYADTVMKPGATAGKALQRDARSYKTN